MVDLKLTAKPEERWANVQNVWAAIADVQQDPDPESQERRWTAMLQSMKDQLLRWQAEAKGWRIAEKIQGFMNQLTAIAQEERHDWHRSARNRYEALMFFLTNLLSPEKVIKSRRMGEGIIQFWLDLLSEHNYDVASKIANDGFRITLADAAGVNITFKLLETHAGLPADIPFKIAQTAKDGKFVIENMLTSKKCSMALKDADVEIDLYIDDGAAGDEAIIYGIKESSFLNGLRGKIREYQQNAGPYSVVVDLAPNQTITDKSVRVAPNEVITYRQSQVELPISRRTIVTALAEAAKNDFGRWDGGEIIDISAWNKIPPRSRLELIELSTDPSKAARSLIEAAKLARTKDANLEFFNAAKLLEGMYSNISDIEDKTPIHKLLQAVHEIRVEAARRDKSIRENADIELIAELISEDPALIADVSCTSCNASPCICPPDTCQSCMDKDCTCSCTYCKCCTCSCESCREICLPCACRCPGCSNCKCGCPNCVDSCKRCIC